MTRIDEQAKIQPRVDPVPVSEVQRVVAMALDLPPAYLGLSRRALKQAQSVAIIVLRQGAGLTYPELARMFGRADDNLAKLAKYLQQGRGHDASTTQSWLHTVMAQCRRTQSVRRVLETVSQVSGLPVEAILRWQDIDRGGKICLYTVSQCCRVQPPRSWQVNLCFPSIQGLSQAAIERTFGFADNFRAFRRYNNVVPVLRQKDRRTDALLSQVEYRLGLRATPPPALTPAPPTDAPSIIRFNDIRAIVARHCQVEVARLKLNEQKLTHLRMAVVYISITRRLAAPHQLFAFSGRRESGLRSIVRTHVPQLQQSNLDFARRLASVESRVTLEATFRDVIQLVADVWAINPAYLPYESRVERARRLALFALGACGHRADVTFGEGARRLGLGRNKFAVASARQHLKRQLGKEVTLAAEMRSIFEEIGLPCPEMGLNSHPVPSGRLDVKTVLDATAVTLGIDATLFNIDPRTSVRIRWAAVYLCKERGVAIRTLVGQAGYSADQIQHICNHGVPEALRLDAVFKAYVNAVRKSLQDDSGWDEVAAAVTQRWDAPAVAARHHPQLAIGRQIVVFILQRWRHLLTATMREAERQLGYERWGRGRDFNEAFQQKLQQDESLAWIVFRIEHRLGRRPRVLHERYGLGQPIDTDLSPDMPWRVAFEQGVYTVSTAALTPQLQPPEQPAKPTPTRQRVHARNQKPQRHVASPPVVQHKHFGIGTVVKFDPSRNVITVAFRTGATKTLIADPQFFNDLPELQLHDWVATSKSPERPIVVQPAVGTSPLPPGVTITRVEPVYWTPKRLANLDLLSEDERALMLELHPLDGLGPTKDA